MRLETEEDVQRLIDERIPESYILDYKKEPWPDKKGKNTPTEIAKDISSFANTQGGRIILGVEENKKTKEPIAKCPFEIANWEERVEDVRHNIIRPYIEGLRIWRVKSDEQEGKAYLVIEIPESPNAPHMVTTSNKYYRRDNSGAKPMGEAEVAAFYKLREEQEKRLEEFYASLFEIFKVIESLVSPEDTKWFCFMLPRPPRKGRLPLFQEEFRNFLSGAVKRYGWSDFTDRPIQGKDYVGFVDADGHNKGYERSNSSIWLHQDGGILAINPRLTLGTRHPPMEGIIPPDFLIWFLEAPFKFAKTVYSQIQSIPELKVRFLFKNMSKWKLVDFFDRYDENLENWLRAPPAQVPFPHIIENPHMENDLSIDRNVLLSQLEDDDIRQYVRETFLKEIFRVFGQPILDK